MYWVFNRPLEYTVEWLDRVTEQAHLADANMKALKAGYHYGDTVELFDTRYKVPEAKIDSKMYRQITGNQATAYGPLLRARRQDSIFSSAPIRSHLRATCSTSCKV